MKKLLLSIVVITMLFSCNNKSTLTTTTFTPTFNGVQGQYCGVVPTINSDGSIDFREGRVQSIEKYKNITKVTATVDLSGLNSLNWVNASFYMVNGGPGYCDAGGSSTYCNEIDFMETNGNVLSQTTIHLGSSNSANKESLEFSYLNSINTNSCWNQDYLSNPGSGVNNATVIDPTKPFDITIEFTTDYTNMTVTYSQDSNSVVVYDFLSHTKGNDSSIDNLNDLKATMESGWSIVASYWQGYSPDQYKINGNEWYNYNDPACKDWSNVCSGTYKISNIVVTAESVVGEMGQVEAGSREEASILRIHEGLYAFCGASGAEPTGRKIIVQGVEFDEGCATCPVLTGPSISNLAMEGISPSWAEATGTKGEFNIKNNFQYPGYDGSTEWNGKNVWSLYWYFDSTSTVPQYNPKTQEWEMLPPGNRSFIVNTDYPATSESNMFCLPCQIVDTTDTGIILAKCYGPLNEAAVPLRKAIPVKSGMTSITAAIEGKPYPVGTPIPTNK